jgi:hypothetical protein
MCAPGMETPLLLAAADFLPEKEEDWFAMHKGVYLFILIWVRNTTDEY